MVRLERVGSRGGVGEIVVMNFATGTLSGKFTQTSRIEIKRLLKTKGL
jgi:hypothetical protein